MTADDLLKAITGVILGALSTAVGWLISRVIGNREQILVLSEKVDNLERQAVTKEDIRTVVREELGERDKKLTLVIKGAVSEAIEDLRDRLSPPDPPPSQKKPRG